MVQSQSSNQSGREYNRGSWYCPYCGGCTGPGHGGMGQGMMGGMANLKVGSAKDAGNVFEIQVTTKDNGVSIILSIIIGQVE
jgi:hypothetical protein